MISKLKKLLYFPVASYFRFFAAIRLKRWKPKIIVVTGSNGKTTLLHLLEAQIGARAKYSHHANSSYGIPFDILDLHRKSLLKSEWISLILKTPFSAFKKPPKERLYVVEADCDRPGEGKFLASFLMPSIVLWISTAKTHSMNFEHLVSRHPGEASTSIGSHKIDSITSLQNDKFSSVEEAIAYEFGYFLQYAKELVLIDGDSELIVKQIGRTKARIVQIKKEKSLAEYKVRKEGTTFTIENKKYYFKYFLPEEVFYSIEMVRKTCEILNISFDQSFSHFQMPPGRGSIFNGIKETIIIDSSYNLSPESLKVVLQTFDKLSVKNKWVVVGDMLELGESEKEEHEKLAEILVEYNFDKIILMGPRVMKYTFAKLMKLAKKNTPMYIHAFNNPSGTLVFLKENIAGGEMILFKGARFMEGVIEHLLENKEDVKKLARREEIWEIRRRQWGL